jgi:hypothetical protein
VGLGWATRDGPSELGQNMLLGRASGDSGFQWNTLSLQGHKLGLGRGCALLGRPVGGRGGPVGVGGEASQSREGGGPLEDQAEGEEKKIRVGPDRLG